MSMVEKVARALEPDAWFNHDNAFADIPAVAAEVVAPSLRQARAAIEAMRKPTAEMVAAADEAHDTFDMRYPSVYTWTSMIDAALGEKS